MFDRLPQKRKVVLWSLLSVDDWCNRWNMLTALLLWSRMSSSLALSTDLSTTSFPLVRTCNLNSSLAIPMMSHVNLSFYLGVTTMNKQLRVCCP